MKILKIQQQKKALVFIISALIVFQQIVKADSDDDIKTPEDFKGGFFQFNDLQSDLYQCDVFKSPNDSAEGNILLAFGDFDGDTFTDFITTHKKNNQIHVDLFSWDNSEYSFGRRNICGGTTNDCGSQVINVYPADINYDGKLDILLLMDDSDGGEVNRYRQLIPIFLDSDKDKSNDLSGVKMYIDSQPFLANLQNTDDGSSRQTQIIYENENQIRKVIPCQVSQKDEDNRDFRDYISEKCDKNQQIYPFSNPHYNSVVDINGDCMADLVLTTKRPDGDVYIEFWIYDEKNDGLYCHDSSSDINTNISAELTFSGVQFADFNFDGTVDAALLYEDKDNKNTLIYINVNSQKVDTGDLCKGGTWEFQNMEKITPYEIKGYTLPDPSDLTDVSDIIEPTIHSQLRFGDINHDGYNDLILVLQQNDVSMPYVLLNKANKSADKQGIEFSFQNGKDDYSLEKLFEKSNYRFLQATFFDINENGILDVFLNYYNPDTKQVETTAVYNYIKNQNYFLKTLGLDGQCKKESCQSALYYGATFMCKVTVSDNSSRAQKGVQLSQSGYSPLQLPFSILGLGRTNNYIENLMAGYPQKTDPSHRVWQTIIPNSQLIIYPQSENINNWSISIFVQPTKAVIVVIIVTATILVVLGLAIIYCHIKEKEEDKKNSESLYQIFR